jgi:hypothetical protein
MTTLFISISLPPLDETCAYRIDLETYADQMKKNWPYAKVMTFSGDYVLWWELNHENKLGPQGGLQDNRLVVSFGNAPEEDVIDFILWHRDFVPKDVPLFLFDESLYLTFEIRSGVTRQELTALMEA